MSEPTIKELEEHQVEERQNDKRYFPPSGLTIPHKTKYFNIDEWLDFRKQNNTGE